MTDYRLTKNYPVARFFYKGQSHSHPVRRTILVIESNRKTITGYELREGDEVRNFRNAPVKTYRKSRIARICNVDARRVIRRDAKRDDLCRTTLVRKTLENLIKYGA